MGSIREPGASGIQIVNLDAHGLLATAATPEVTLQVGADIAEPLRDKSLHVQIGTATAALAHGVHAVVVRNQVAQRFDADIAPVLHCLIEARPAAEGKRASLPSNGRCRAPRIESTSAAMQPPWLYLIALVPGYALSLGLGRLIVPRFSDWTKRTYLRHIRQDPATKPDPRLASGPSSNITGWLERGVFTPLVMITPETAAIAMGGWLALKMAAQWQREAPKGIGPLEWRGHAFLALQSGFLSMAFAGAGGGLAIYVTCLLRS
jgi:hypothetical protein